MFESSGMTFILAGYQVVLYAVSVAIYLLTAFAIFNMGKKLNVSCPWLAFIPVANVYAFGKIAEHYKKENQQKSAKFSVILLVLDIIFAVLTIIFMVFVFMLLANIAVNMPENPTLFDESQIDFAAIGVIIIPLVFSLFAMLGIAIAVSVVYYVALWRIFAIFDPENATLYLVLSIFFSFLLPIFLFIIRKKEPQIREWIPMENIM